MQSLDKTFYKTQLMKKIVIGMLFFGSLGLKAQYGTLNAILDRLEARKGINQHLENVNIDNKSLSSSKMKQTIQKGTSLSSKETMPPTWKFLMIKPTEKVVPMSLQEILSEKEYRFFTGRYA